MKLDDKQDEVGRGKHTRGGEVGLGWRLSVRPPFS
jgi:hypothetical protein